MLVEATEPADPMLADLISKIVSNLLPVITGELWGRRAAGAALTNTDGHRLALITGLMRVDAPAAAAERRAAHEDFQTEEGGVLTWWGRELSEMEQQTTLATVCAATGADAAEYDETPRWLRGRLKSLRRETVLHLSGEGLCLHRETLVLGRHGEQPGRAQVHNRVERDGAPVLDDTLDTSDLSVFRSAAVAGSARLVSSLGLYGVTAPGDVPDGAFALSEGDVLARRVTSDIAAVTELDDLAERWRATLML